MRPRARARGNSPSSILFNFQGSFSAFATARRHATSRSQCTTAANHISRSATATYSPASAPAISAANRLLAASLTRRKRLVFPDPPFQQRPLVKTPSAPPLSALPNRRPARNPGLPSPVYRRQDRRSRDNQNLISNSCHFLLMSGPARWWHIASDSSKHRWA